MSRFASVFAVIALCATAALAQIPPAPMEVVWEGMFPPPYLTNPQLVLAMDCVSKSKCYLGGGSNGAGFGVFEYDGKMNGQVSGPMAMPNMSMMVMDITVGGTEAAPKGAFNSVDMLGISKALQYLAETGKEWLPSKMPNELIWASESIAGNADESLIAAVGEGPFTSQSGDIMLSKDYGHTFTNQPITFKMDNCSAATMLATPSPDVWFMTGGSTPPQNNSNNGGGGGGGGGNQVDGKYLKNGEMIIGRKLRGQLLIIRQADGKVREHFKSVKAWREDLKQAQFLAGPKCGYSGFVLKSTDQGKTWTKVYENPTANPDGITCFDATHCAVSMYSAEFASTLVTTDGNTFKVTYTTPAPTQQMEVNVGAYAYYSQTELWAGGSQDSQAGGKGMFWKSMDSGETWTAYPHMIPDLMGIIAMDFADEVGFAVGITQFKTSQIMRYKRQADYGTFTQKNCPTDKCDFLCQSNAFPQGMCLQTKGGSIKIFCSDNGVMSAYQYDTTSCVYGYTKHILPTNKCLNGTNGFFENVCPVKGAAPHKGALAGLKDFIGF